MSVGNMIAPGLKRQPNASFNKEEPFSSTIGFSSSSFTPSFIPFGATKFTDVLPDCPDCTCALSGSLTGLALRTVRYSQETLRVLMEGSPVNEAVQAMRVRAERCRDPAAEFSFLQHIFIIPQLPQTLLPHGTAACNRTENMPSATLGDR